MATRNIDQLVLRVLRNLNQLRPGEDPASEEAEIVADQWASTHAELVDDGIAYWPRDAIPLAVFDSVAWLVAVNCAPAYGALPIALQAIGVSNAEIAADSIKVKLRTHASKEWTGERMKVIPY